MNEIFNFRRKDQDNYYEVLGCSIHSSEEQINKEYKILALKYHPDKHEDKELYSEKFQNIKKAKEVLCDAEKRKLYDKWLINNVSISFQQFLNYSKCCSSSFHWSNKKPEPMITLNDTLNLGLNNNIEYSNGNYFIQNNQQKNLEPVDSIQKENLNSMYDNKLNNILYKFRNYEI